MAPVTDWVLAAERAYVASATGRASPSAGAGSLPHARAAAGAIASRFLAVGTPRSLGLVAGPGGAHEAALSLAAHRTWFQPRDVRCAGNAAEELAREVGGRVTPLAEALACDIVCVHAPLHLEAGALRRGTHVNVLVRGTLAPELAQLATVVDEEPGLGELAAGLVDGRQLDELTVFVLGDARIARAAVGAAQAP